MAPQPPEIRPRPKRKTNPKTSTDSVHQKSDSKESAKKILKKVVIPKKKRSFSFSPGDHRSHNFQKEGGVVLRPQEQERKDYGQNRRPRQSSGGASRNNRTQMHRMSSKIQSPMFEKKFFPQEGTLKGTESFDPTGKKGLKPDTLYLVPVGGLEEVGRNSMFFEYNDEIIMIDAGIQFPEEETPGIDWIIPNVNYLEKKKKNIKALIITHAHYDHFGAVPYILERIGNPTIYGTKMVRAFLEKRVKEMPNVPKIKFVEIKNHDKVKLSKNFSMEVFGVCHTVPDTTGILLETPAGKLAHFADFRLDYDKNGKAINLEEFEWLGKQNVHSLLLDSTNADYTGNATSEETVVENLEKLFLEAEGRIILSTFASMIERLGEIINIGEKIGRKVIINGRSMKEAIQMAKDLGYIKHGKDVVIPIEDITKYPDNKLLILSTGAQGQENSGLMRIVNGGHKHIRIKPGDTMIFSSSVIPGNERSVQNLKDNFARQGALVHTNSDLDIHSSGHSPGDDLTLVAKMTKPKFVIPIHAHFFKRSANLKNMKAAGIAKENVFLIDNGSVLEIQPDTIELTKHEIDAYYVMVDGLGVGDVEAVVVRDRQHLAQEGMIVVISTLDKKTGSLLKNPDIISRGFIYLKDNTKLIDDIRQKIRSLMQQTKISQTPDSDYVKALIRDQVGLLIYKKTERRPMILPVVIEI